jgi:DNA ligase-1
MADIENGASIEVKGSGAKPYTLRNTNGVYSCSCPAWRNQSIPVERRTCKHLRRLRGDEAEQERIGGSLRPASATFSSGAGKDAPQLLLATIWDGSSDPTGWWMSEKLDGVRALWDGNRLLSRQGNVFAAPPWFVEELPDVALDGELWIGRRKFQETVSVVRSKGEHEGWKQVRFLAFDAPTRSTPWEERLKFLQQLFPSKRKGKSRAAVVEQALCKGVDHVRTELQRVEKVGGEGVMLRQPGSSYEAGRSGTLLKVKSFLDAEATVLRHQPGRGKLRGVMGALLVSLPDGTEFAVGTGFSDRERADPPPVGSVITFRYQELSKAGVPRFPSFVRIAESPTPPSRKRAPKT